jgi:hypothetical protein
METARERDWEAPAAPGEIRDGTRYVIPSPDDHYGPWVVTASKPRKRDFWKVLRGKWEPQLTVSQALTMKGMNRELKFVYHGPTLAEQLHDSSLLFEAFKDVPEGTARVTLGKRP